MCALYVLQPASVRACHHGKRCVVVLVSLHEANLSLPLYTRSYSVRHGKFEGRYQRRDDSCSYPPLGSGENLGYSRSSSMSLHELHKESDKSPREGAAERVQEVPEDSDVRRP